MRGYTSFIRREPLGIVGGIAPWNYPLMMAVWKLAPALAAGNVQVLKPSEQTPLSLLRFAELAADVIPAGVLNVVTGDGVPVGERDRHAPRRAARLADRRRRDREDDRAHRRRHAQARPPRARRQGAGASSSTTPIRPRSPRGSRSPATGTPARTAPPPRASSPGPKIYDRLLEELVPAVESLHVGDPAEGDEIEMGPVISKAQQERVFGFLERAKGATVLTGGECERLGRGFFVEPTVVTDVGQADEIVQREVFGPVVTVQRFADDDEALAWANDVPLRPRRVGVDARRRPRAERRAAAPVRHGLDQRPHPARRPRCRTAATSSPATARTSRRTRSRTTRRSST